MLKLKNALLFLALVAGACSNDSVVTESFSAQLPTSTAAVSVVTATEMPEKTETVVPAREAVLSEVVNKVMMRVSSYEEMTPASNGMSLYETGGVETSDGSRTRLDLLPDGTIVRVGPNSSFTLKAITREDGSPKTILELLWGQAFILLNGGSLDVETTSGSASVRGSLMGVTLSPDFTRLAVTCLEGHCFVRDENEERTLIAGQAVDILDGKFEGEIRDMYFEELGLWMLNNPDLKKHISELPNLSDLPAGFDWDYDFSSDSSFDFFFDPAYNPGERISDPDFGVRRNNDDTGNGGHPRRGNDDPRGPRN